MRISEQDITAECERFPGTDRLQAYYRLRAQADYRARSIQSTNWIK